MKLKLGKRRGLSPPGAATGVYSQAVSTYWDKKNNAFWYKTQS